MIIPKSGKVYIYGNYYRSCMFPINDKLLQKTTTLCMLLSIAIFANLVILDYPQLFAKQDNKFSNGNSAYYDNGYFLVDGQKTIPHYWMMNR